MRRYLVPASLIAALALSGAAMATTTTTTGKIKSFDMKTHELKLDNGIVYKLPATFKDPGLKAGEKVAVSWEMKAGQHDATTVTVVK